MFENFENPKRQYFSSEFQISKSQCFEIAYDTLYLYFVLYNTFQVGLRKYNKL